MKHTHARCDSSNCGTTLPVAELETVGRLRYCPGCAKWERRYAESDAEQHRADAVQFADQLRTDLGLCTPSCYCCERGVPADGYLTENGTTYAHTGRPREAAGLVRIAR